MSNDYNGFQSARSNDLYYYFPLGVVIPLSLGRYAIRVQTRGRIYPDDVAHFIAAAFSTAFNVLGHNAESFVRSSRPSVSKILLLDLLFFGGLWAVKACLLFLYRDVFWISTSFRRVWYATMGVTVVFGLVTFGLQVSVAGMSDTQVTSYTEMTSYATARPLLGMYLDLSTSLISKSPGMRDYIPAHQVRKAYEMAVLLIPLWILSPLHLRRSINWGIAAVYLVGLGGFSLAITGAVSIEADESVSALLGCWGVWLEVIAAGMVGYVPLLIPSQRRQIWPWSKRPDKLADQEEQKPGKRRWPWSKRKADGASDELSIASAGYQKPDMNPKRKRHNTMASVASLIPRSSRSSSEIIEMRHFSTSTEYEGARVLPYSHLSGRREDMDS